MLTADVQTCVTYGTSRGSQTAQKIQIQIRTFVAILQHQFRIKVNFPYNPPKSCVTLFGPLVNQVSMQI